MFTLGGWRKDGPALYPSPPSVDRRRSIGVNARTGSDDRPVGLSGV